MGLGLANTVRANILKKLLAMSLARIFIPILIVYNMVFYQAGHFSLLFFCFIFFFIFQKIS